jgi:sterol 3beta-glucosyltransferase
VLAKDPDAFTRAVLDGLARSGRRAVLATGWGALRPSDVPETVHVLDLAPHDWLLPRTSVAVHHGGVGTVAAALRAGVPQVIRPFLGDQPFWARRVHEIGIAAAPLTGRFTADRLAAALDDATPMAGAARELVARVREEDGVTAAVARIERTVARS